MGLLRGALKTGIAVKVFDVARREARKPENQRKAKELLGRLSDRRKGRRPTR